MLFQHLESVESLGSTGRKDWIGAFHKDFLFFFKHYLPDYKDYEFRDFHKEIIDVLESCSRISIRTPWTF